MKALELAYYRTTGKLLKCGLQENKTNIPLGISVCSLRGHQSWALCFVCAFIFLVPNHHLRGVWENDGFEDYEWPFAT